jgi:large subunit ribosomal protein L25
VAEQPTLHVRARESTGKGTARKLRRQGLVPGSLFGRGEPQSITVDLTEFRHTVAPGHYGSQMINVELDGRPAGSALVKAVQVNPIGRQILHIDLQRVSMEDRISVAVPLLLEGEPAGARAGGVLEQLTRTLTVECRAGDIPQEFHYDVAAMEIGDTLHAAQVALPVGCALMGPQDEVIAILSAPTLPVLEEPVEVEEGVVGPELTDEKQHEDFPPER